MFFQSKSQNSDPLSPTWSFFKIHGSHGVTDVLYLDSTEELWSLGRDGKLRVWELRALSSGHTLSLAVVCERQAGPNFEWPRKFLRKGKCDGGILIAGFRAVSNVLA